MARKGRGQSLARALKRGNIDQRGVSLKRPFNNRKRTKGRQAQNDAQDFYEYIKARFVYLKKVREQGEKDKLIEKQIKLLDEGISNN